MSAPTHPWITRITPHTLEGGRYEWAEYLCPVEATMQACAEFDSKGFDVVAVVTETGSPNVTVIARRPKPGHHEWLSP